MASATAEIKVEATVASTLALRILSLCKEFPDGIGDKLLQASMPDVEAKDRVLAINTLLTEEKIALFKSPGKGLLYKVRDASSQPDRQGSSSNPAAIKGDAEEKLIYKIIEESGNKGTWIRDIRNKSNLSQVQLNRVLKSLKSKKLIKDVKCVNSARKIVYMLYNVEPDSSVTGGAWYSDQDFESEFVDILNQQCYRYLVQKDEMARKSSSENGPLAARSASQARAEDVLKYITELGISTVQLKVDDIEAILNTLIYDGKVEKSIGILQNNTEVKLYRAVERLLPITGLVRVPCGLCPVIKRCDQKEGDVNPFKCKYMKEWMA